MKFEIIINDSVLVDAIEDYMGRQGWPNKMKELVEEAVDESVDSVRSDLETHTHDDLEAEVEDLSSRLEEKVDMETVQRFVEAKLSEQADQFAVYIAKSRALGEQHPTKEEKLGSPIEVLDQITVIGCSCGAKIKIKHMGSLIVS